MKNVKKILSLVLVLVLAFGCLGISASATNPVYPPILDITVNGYSAGLSVSGSTITYTARVPSATFPLSNASLIVHSNPNSLAEDISCLIDNASIDETELTDDDPDFYASQITLLGTNQLTICWTIGGVDFEETYTLNVISGSGNAALSSLTATNYTLSFVDSKTYTIGGVTRNTRCYKLPDGTNESVLNNLELTVTPVNDSASIKLDGQPLQSRTFTADFYAKNHVLRIQDGNDVIEFMLTVCAPNTLGKIPVNFGVRTFAVVDFNNANPRYDYSAYGTAAHDGDIDALAASVDSYAIANNTAAASPTWVTDSVSGEDRPVFQTSQYMTVWVYPGATVMSILASYATSNNLVVDGLNDSYVTSITSSSGTVGYMTCGWGDSWMYLVRSAYNSVEDPLPNCAGDLYFVTNGHYADWVFSCAFGEDLGYDIMSLS